MVNDFLDKSGIMALWNRAKSIFITAESPGTVVSTNPLNADLLNGQPGSYYLNTSDIIDDLTSTSTTDALSANQGRVLSGNIAAALAAIPATVNNLTSTSTTDALAANQGRVLKGLIDNIPTPVDNLTSTSTTEPLSANQGRVLNANIIAAIESIPDPIDSLTSISTTESLSANQGRVLNSAISSVASDLTDLDAAKAPIASPTFTGAAKVASGTDYTTAKLRNVILSTDDPDDELGSDGDIWIVYTAE